jgi:hypothetical protein
MGALQASEFAAAVKNSEIDLEPALHWHLTANHWPPLPVEYVDILSAVIRDINSGVLEDTDDVVLPRSLRIFPGDSEEDDDGDFVVFAGDLLDATNCWFFINDEPQ